MAARPPHRMLWVVARLLGLSPFDVHVLSLTDDQIDWILAQHDLDYPPPPPDPVKDWYEAKERELLADIAAGT